MARPSTARRPHSRRRSENHASGRAAFCRSHDRPSALVSRQIYDTRTRRSRFLEVDPVEGGSCNDYDYVCADPVNDLDLAGTFKWKKLFKKAVRIGRGIGESIAIAGTAAVATGACGGNPLCGIAAGAALGAGFGALNHKMDNRRDSIWKSVGTGAAKGAAVGALASLGYGRSGEATRPGKFLMKLIKYRRRF